MGKVMGEYCKAYYLRDFRKFGGWKENLENVRKEKEEINGEEVEVGRQLTDDSIVYLQENFVVTDGVFKENNVLYDLVTEEWLQYCQNELGFRIPEYDKTIRSNPIEKSRRTDVNGRDIEKRGKQD